MDSLLSLKQGKQFKKLKQNKQNNDKGYYIQNKQIEGFTLNDQAINASITSNINSLKSRESPANPYTNNNVSFTDNSGTNNYVSNSGVVKTYQDNSVYDATSGKNGCPINLKTGVGKDQYSSALEYGTSVVNGQSCGNEGVNVNASQLVGSMSSTFSGCYKNSGQTQISDVTTFDGCQQYALDNGFSYFGVQSTPDNALKCFVNSSTTNMEDGSYKYISSTIWKTNTTGTNTLILNANNTLTIINSISEVVWTSNEPPNDCAWGGNVNQNTITGSYGANCIGKPLNIDCGKPDPNKSYTNTPTLTKATYVGCFTDKNIRAIPTLKGVFTYQECYDAALKDEKTVFGLQNVQANNKGQCFLGNDLTSAKKYGKSTNCKVVADGKSYGGKWANAVYSIEDVAETNGSGAIIGNLDTILRDKASAFSSSNSVGFAPLKKWTGPDPAPCCVKNIDYSYQCGNGGVKSGTADSGGIIKFDCNAEMIACKCYLVVQDDANVVIYKGADPSVNNGVIWNSVTYGKQKSPNPDWEASKGKYGRNYIIIGETLTLDEWVGSTNGSARLIMQNDGNLVIETSEKVDGCMNTDKPYGRLDEAQGINSIGYYGITNMGNKASLGKIGYVTPDSILREYDKSLIGYSNDYTKYNNSDSSGNDIKQIKSETIADCEKACNNLEGCGGYVWNSQTKICYLKTSGMYPNANRQVRMGYTMGVRNKTVNDENSCAIKTVNIDTIQFDNYVKGDPISSNTQCPQQNIVTSDQKNKIKKMGSGFEKWSDNKLKASAKLVSSNKANIEIMKETSAKYKDAIGRYNDINSQLNNLTGNNNGIISEGMSNLNEPNMNDVNKMQEDSELIVISEHYEYIMWTLLALGVLTITIKTLKK